MLRPSPRLYLIILQLLTHAHYTFSTNHVSIRSQAGYFTLMIPLMILFPAAVRNIYRQVFTGRPPAKRRITAAEFYEITGHRAGRKVAIKYQDRTRPLVCNCCNAWVPHATLWNKHARTQKHRRIVEEWLACPSSIPMDHNTHNSRLSPLQSF